MSKIYDDIQSKLEDTEWSKKIAHRVIARKKQDRKNKNVIISLAACLLFVFSLNITSKNTNRVSWETEIIPVFFDSSDDYVFSSEIDKFIEEMF